MFGNLPVSTVAQFIQIVLCHAKMMPDFVQHCRPHLIDELLLGVADYFHILLEDVDHVRKCSRLQNTPLSQGMPQ